MSDRGSKTFPSSHRQPYPTPQEVAEPTDVEYDNYSDEETTSNDDYGEWCPGDGVCPSISQFNMVYLASYNAWNSAASKKTRSYASDPFYIDSFLHLLEEVPAFFHKPPKGVVQGSSGSVLALRASLELETTTDPTCDQRWKNMDYLQCLGFPEPMTYKVDSDTLRPPSISLGLTPDCLTSITLAWSYILSCRWVEILSNVGEESSLCHDGGEEISNNFWDLVTRSRWTAQVQRKKRTFYAPWMLRYENHEKEISYNMVQVSPNASIAFDILLEFCASEGLMNECVIALAMALMLTSRNVPPPKLAAPMKISRSVMPTGNRDARAESLFSSLDKCMSLSSTQDALDSLLCSVFFDLSVPCNLLGALSLGITEALLPADNNYQRLIEAISDKRPELALLWVAVVCNGQAMPMLTMVLKNLAPICLVAAFWTNTTQSFLQVTYGRRNATDTEVSRSCEFSTSYFCRPEASTPWSPAPPFGSTSTFNMSLEVKQHYRHGHRPLRWRSHWILRSGEKVPASSQDWVKLPPICSLQQLQAADPEYEQQQQQEQTQTRKQNVADEQSWSATSRLFNWHRIHEGGLWLDDGTTGDIEAIRKLQQHPWIIDPFFDNGGSAPSDEQKHPRLERESILQWIHKVEE